MNVTIGFQTDPFAVKLPKTLKNHEVRAHSRQQLTTKNGLKGRLWVVHYPQLFANSIENDTLWFIPADRQKLFELGTLPESLNTTKTFTATVIVTNGQTTFQFKQGWWGQEGELTYNGVLTLTEGEKAEPAKSYTPLLAVGALVATVGIAYFISKRPRLLPNGVNLSGLIARRRTGLA